MAGPWITDRLPTAEDGDDDGDVLAHSYETDSGFRVTPWERVVRNQPWMHIHEAERRPARKIAQLINADGYLIALSDDGAAFHLYFGGSDRYEWRQLPPLPQP